MGGKVKEIIIDLLTLVAGGVIGMILVILVMLIVTVYKIYEKIKVFK